MFWLLQGWDAKGLLGSPLPNKPYPRTLFMTVNSTFMLGESGPRLPIPPGFPGAVEGLRGAGRGAYLPICLGDQNPKVALDS